MQDQKLFPRRSTSTKRLEVIAKAAAHRVLDRIKAGDVSVWDRCEWALKVTGDLDPVRQREIEVMP